MEITRTHITGGAANPVSHIENWYDLAAVLGLKTGTLSYALRERDKLIHGVITEEIKAG